MENCLKNLGKCYEGCEEEISELVYQINKMLNEKKLEWEASYKELLLRNKQLADDCDGYQLELEDKSAEIEDLRKEISIIDRSNYEKRMALESKVSDLSQIVRNLKNRNKADVHLSNDDSLELAVSALKKECDYYQDKIAELEVVQTTHVAQIKLLEEQRCTILQKNEEIKQKFSKCRKEYQSKVNATDSELNTLAKQKKELETQIKVLKSQLTEKDEELQNVQDTLEGVLSSNQKNNTAFSNMQKTLDVANSEIDSLKKEVENLLSKNDKLELQNQDLAMKIDSMERNAENSSYGAKTEVNKLKAQLEIYVKENDFLRTFLLQQERPSSTQRDHFQYLEKLEADNNSLKDNIANMETEIANLLRLSEPNKAVGVTSPSSSKVEVRQVKERYDRHLMNMKAEVEQLTLENLSLKAMHQHCDHSMVSGIESKNNSLLISNSSKNLEEQVDIDYIVPVPDSPALYSEKSVIDSPCQANSEKSLSIGTPLTKEFKELQENVLKQFEAKLNECVTNFYTSSVAASF